MKQRIISQKIIREFADYLIKEEKSSATCEKYLRDVKRFWEFSGGKFITKELMMVWKQSLIDTGYAVRSINSMLASVNSLLNFLNWKDCKVKNIRMQRQIYCSEDRELRKGEYLQLLEASQRDPQMNMVIQTICATGIRVSELRYFTVEAVSQQTICVNCKGKIRTIMIPGKLRKMLLKYAKQVGIVSGVIFTGKNKKPLDRSVIWRKMKEICKKAGIRDSKVFPHNLRKLFAYTFYQIEKDIVKLADILGHSSINTTRIYIMTTGLEHRRKMEKMGLII